MMKSQKSSVVVTFLSYLIMLIVLSLNVAFWYVVVHFILKWW